MLDALTEKIRATTARVGVVGLGTVGLSVACAFADAGFRVSGVDREPSRVDAVRAGTWPFAGKEPALPSMLSRWIREGRLSASTDVATLSSCDVVLIAVDTPVDAEHEPRLAPLEDACRALGPHLAAGTLVIVESTVPPGTTMGVVAPLLGEASGMRHGEGFFVGHCPERVMTGRLLENLTTLARVCGGATPEIAAAMRVLYGAVVEGPLAEADCVTAELVKTAENTYRDVNIAFANELALACRARGADFLRVRELVNLSPGRHVLLAGAGVGGQCIPKDPWLLAHGLGEEETRLLRAARAVNEAMPLHVVDLVGRAIDASGSRLGGAQVAVLGYAYMEETGEAQNTPSAVVVAELERRGATVRVHDAWIEEMNGDPIGVASGADAVVVMVSHAAYRALDLERLARVMAHRVLVDPRRVVDAQRARAAGFIYESIGLG